MPQIENEPPDSASLPQVRGVYVVPFLGMAVATTSWGFMHGSLEPLMQEADTNHQELRAFLLMMLNDLFMPLTALLLAGWTSPREPRLSRMLLAGLACSVGSVVGALGFAALRSASGSASVPSSLPLGSIPIVIVAMLIVNAAIAMGCFATAWKLRQPRYAPPAQTRPLR